MEPWMLVVFVVVVVLAASVAQTVAGFGFSLLTVPILVTVIDVRDVFVLTTILALANTSIVVRTAWRHVPWATVGPMLAGAVTGMPFGLAVLLLAPEDVLRLGVGITTIAMVALLASGVRIGTRSTASEVGVGLVSGALSTSTSMNGPPVVLYLQGREHTRDEFRGALAVYFSSCSLIALLIFTASLIVTPRAVALALVALPAIAAGSYVGHALVRRVPAEAFRRIVLSLLVISAISVVSTSIARIVA